MANEAELEILESEGITGEDVEEARINAPEKPEFPFLIFMLAAAKDIVDWVGLGVAGTIVNIIVAPIMFLYLRNKVGYVQKWIYKRYVFTMILEFIPFVNLIPQNSIFVIRAYLKENEQIDKVLSFIESFAKV